MNLLPGAQDRRGHPRCGRPAVLAVDPVATTPMPETRGGGMVRRSVTAMRASARSSADASMRAYGPENTD